MKEGQGSRILLFFFRIYSLDLTQHVRQNDVFEDLTKGGEQTGTKEFMGRSLPIQIKQRLVLLPRKRFIVVTSR